MFSLPKRAHRSTLSDQSSKETYIAGLETAYMPPHSQKLENFFSNRVVNHLVFWVVITLLTAYHGSLFGRTFYTYLISLITLLPIQMFAAYFLVYYQVPKWLFKEKWVYFIGSLILSSYICVVIARLIIVNVSEYILEEGIGDESLSEILSDPVYLLKVYILSVYLPAFILFMVKMTKERFVQQNKMNLLEKEKGKAELKFLKAQMNPHFLFNTLNNIYALASSNSKHTGEMILKLSDLLDYTIYECNAPKVKVENEWALIENYADLEALRFGKNLELLLKYQSDDPEAEIAPLILIPYVENAFKHNTKSKDVKPFIHIDLEIKGNLLIFEIKNSRSVKSLSPDQSPGIGNSNTNQQLSILYPDRHNVYIQEEKNTYSIQLTINF